MPLVVSSLMGDASDMFNWIQGLNHGNPQDLTTLLQMLREHYCGSLTFREQRNTIENLHQKPNEAAIDFLIRVGTSVSNVAKDWKDELTEDELRALQYEVFLNGVKEEIRHVLDSEARPPCTGSPRMGGKIWNQAPPGTGAYSKPINPRKEQAKTLSAWVARASHRVEKIPYLNPDAFSRFIGPKNWDKALINDELTTCLLDNGAQLNFITPAYAVERGMDIMSLD